MACPQIQILCFDYVQHVQQGQLWRIAMLSVCKVKIRMLLRRNVVLKQAHLRAQANDVSMTPNATPPTRTTKLSKIQSHSSRSRSVLCYTR